ncbi:hypothetical protein BDZ89DRAFT_224142 [Hymenopellis radicata]|nr:hypothetical protein BDZ89DRAFT_224142 [Hymenopellis radicata]
MMTSTSFHRILVASPPDDNRIAVFRLFLISLVVSLDIILRSDIFKHYNYTFLSSALPSALTFENLFFPKPTPASATYRLPPAQIYLHRRRILAQAMDCHPAPEVLPRAYAPLQDIGMV